MPFQSNASNLQALQNGQTYLYNSVAGRSIPAFLSTVAPMASLVGSGAILIGYDQNASISTFRLDSSTNPNLMTVGCTYIPTDVSSPVNFVLPSTAVKGECVKVIGFGTGLFKISATSPQFIAIGNNAANFVTAQSQFCVIHFFYTASTPTPSWEAYGITGSFKLN